MRVGALVLILVASTAIANAFPRLFGTRAPKKAPAPSIVEIVCRPTCVVAEPVLGQRVEVIVKAYATSTLVVVAGVPCPAPCRITWPGVNEIRIATGSGMTFAVISDSGSSRAIVPIYMDVKQEADDNKIFGPSEPVPQHIGTTIVNPEPIPPTGSQGDVHASLDTYFDDVVSIGGGGRSCTGVVVGERHVLTAGHCSSAREIRVARTATEEETFSIVRATAHPDRDLDVALVVTDRVLRLPVRPRSRAPATTSSSGIVKIIGYGATDATGTIGGGTKRQATIAVDDWQCTPLRARRTGCVPERELVITGPSSDTCSGDSGGPALENVAGRWRLAAITSRGIPAARGVCGGGGIYTSVGAIADWIDQEAKTP